MSEYTHTPYRELPIENLGALKPLKTKCKPEREHGDENLQDEDDFETFSKDMRENYINKDEIFKRIRDFLDGFTPAGQPQLW